MFITIALVPFFRGLAVKINALDVPNERKVHKYPMPKSGGIAMALGAFIPILLWFPSGNFTRATIIGAGIVVLFGLLDDMKDLGFKTKFAGQFAAALIVIIYGGVKIKSLGMLLPDGVLLPDWLAMPLTFIVIVGITNAINLSDGLGGLAGGISLLSFLCIGSWPILREILVLLCCRPPRWGQFSVFSGLIHILQPCSWEMQVANFSVSWQ